MTPYEFAETINTLPAQQRNAFFEALKDLLPEEEWLAAVKFISLHGLLLNPGKYTAMKNAVCDTFKEVICNGI